LFREIFFYIGSCIKNLCQIEPKVPFFSLEGTLLLSKSQMGRIGTYWLQKFNWHYKCTCYVYK